MILWIDDRNLDKCGEIKKVSINLSNIFSAMQDCICNAEYYKDKNGNIELYIPETEQHTGFYLKNIQNYADYFPKKYLYNY